MGPEEAVPGCGIFMPTTLGPETSWNPKESPPGGLQTREHTITVLETRLREPHGGSARLEWGCAPWVSSWWLMPLLPFLSSDPSSTYIRPLETKVKLLDGDKLPPQVSGSPGYWLQG